MCPICKSDSKYSLTTAKHGYEIFSCINEKCNHYYFKDFLSYESGYKFVTIILLVIITIIFYIALSIITKAFKISDITLKY